MNGELREHARNNTEGQLGVAKANRPPCLVRTGEEKPRRGAVVVVVLHQACHVHLLLDIGLRVGSGAADAGAPPYILWLCAGLIPWFFMQDMLGAGIDVMHRYPYLVNKIKFPLSGISTIYTGATMLVQLMLMVALFIIYAACGMQFDVYLLQVPILLLLMFVFWDIVSIMFSQLSAISKDVKNLMNAMSTPFFWLSGVIFDVKSVPVDWIQTILYFNPITFFVTSFRGAFYDKVWFWEDPTLCAGFALVFVVTLVLALFVYKKFNEEVADVL